MERSAVFGFLSEPARKDLGSNHHVAGVLLKIACWMSLITTAIVAIAGFFVALFVAIGAGFWRAWMEAAGMPDRWVDFIADMSVLAALVILIGTAFVVALSLLILWWQNHTFHLWNTDAEGAIVWANILGAFLVVTNLGDFTGIVWRDGNVDFSLALGGPLQLILGVLLLVFANVANSKGELGAPNRQPDA